MEEKTLEWADIQRQAMAYVATAGAALVVAAVVAWRNRRSTVEQAAGESSLVSRLRSLLPLPRHPVPPTPTFLNALACLLLLMLVPSMAVGLLEQLGVFSGMGIPAEATMRKVHYVLPLSLLVFVVGAFAVSRSSEGIEPRHVGCTASRWRSNVVLGVALFLVVTPVALAVFDAFAFWHPPEDHAFQEITRGGLPWWEWALIGFAACVKAPIDEEIFCRGFLARWLERASSLAHVALMITCATLTFVVYFSRETKHPMMLVLGVIAMAVHAYFLVAKEKDAAAALADLPEEPNTLGEDDEDGLGDEQAWLESVGISVRRPASSWVECAPAIASSATVFSLMHITVWPSPIPLYLFAWASGLVAWRTRSLIPSIVLHALFNAVAFITLCYSV